MLYGFFYIYNCQRRDYSITDMKSQFDKIKEENLWLRK